MIGSELAARPTVSSFHPIAPRRRHHVRRRQSQGLCRIARSAPGAAADGCRCASEAAAAATADQAVVVGSGVFTFAPGVDPAAREAITNSALLAQLVANKRASAQVDPLAWFATYCEVLQNIGWVLAASGWTYRTAKGTAVEVHEKILEVVTAALGPAPAALAIVGATMNALAGIQPDSPWVTIFNRESKTAKVARFQIGLVEKGAADDIGLVLVACLLDAEAGITQLLFFKLQKNLASFRSSTATASIGRAALVELNPVIDARVRAFRADFLGGLTDL
jgi:hypothetical protein